MSDREQATSDIAFLLRQLREEHSASALRAIVAAYGGLVEGTAARGLGDPDEARDVAQCVFADLLRLAPELAEPP